MTFCLPGQGYTKNVKNLTEIPEGPHWVILMEDTVTTWSGYTEDSGTATTVLNYYVYTDEAKWKDTIRQLEEEKLKRQSLYKDYKFIAFHVDRRAKVRVEVDVKVG